jgi:hypothetical protein
MKNEFDDETLYKINKEANRKNILLILGYPLIFIFIILGIIFGNKFSSNKIDLSLLLLLLGFLYVPIIIITICIQNIYAIITKKPFIVRWFVYKPDGKFVDNVMPFIYILIMMGIGINLSIDIIKFIIEIIKDGT